MVLQALFYDGNRSSLAVGGTVCNLLARRVGRKPPGKSDQTDGGFTVLTKHDLVKYCRASMVYSESFFPFFIILFLLEKTWARFNPGDLRATLINCTLLISTTTTSCLLGSWGAHICAYWRRKFVQHRHTQATLGCAKASHLPAIIVRNRGNGGEGKGWLVGPSITNKGGLSSILPSFLTVHNSGICLLMYERNL